ncbi:MAG: nitrogenase iron-molybdenum cofactor biosynthesis protein NifE [Chitinispirillaceae bacterium]
MDTTNVILDERQKQIIRNRAASTCDIACERRSTAGTVSQRACVFCGSRVVLYPVSDAVHLIHGTIGCAAYTWDIRGSLSSGPQLHRMSFCSDLRELDVIHGGEPKLAASIDQLVGKYHPNAVFVYSTCIVGIIGDDVEAICKKAAKKHGIPVIPVHSEGFRGTKMDGYKAACSALAALVGTGSTQDISPYSINILGDFNIAGETWIIKDYYEQMGIDVVSTITGDGRVGDIKRSHGASLNVVQCSGSMIHLAEHMKEKYGIPYIRVSYFGIEDTARALYAVAEHFDNEQISRRTQEVVRSEIERVMAVIESCRTDLNGKKAAIYVGGAFKAFSLVKSLRMLGMETAVVGSQTGNRQDYQTLAQMCSPETIIVDDANTVELASFVLEKDVDLFIGGVKERPIAYKLGIGFCDHNHERKTALAGFRGMANFAKEVHGTVMSPVWRFTPRRSKRMGV